MASLAMSAGGITIRVRSQIGQWRFSGACRPLRLMGAGQRPLFSGAGMGAMRYLLLFISLLIRHSTPANKGPAYTGDAALATTSYRVYLSSLFFRRPYPLSPRLSHTRARRATKPHTYCICTGVNPGDPAGFLIERIASEKGVPPEQQSLALDPAGKHRVGPHESLAAHGVTENGAMVFLTIDATAAATFLAGAAAPQVPLVTRGRTTSTIKNIPTKHTKKSRDDPSFSRQTCFILGLLARVCRLARWRRQRSGASGPTAPSWPWSTRPRLKTSGRQGQVEMKKRLSRCSVSLSLSNKPCPTALFLDVTSITLQTGLASITHAPHFDNPTPTTTSQVPAGHAQAP